MAFIRGKNKVAQNEKWKKKLWVFVYIKYGKYCSVSPGHFIKHKPLISEECYLGLTGYYSGISKKPMLNNPLIR